MVALEGYLKANHAGLIFTHGSLLDASSPQHIGSLESWEEPSLAKMVGLEILPIAESARKVFNLTDVPAVIPYISTGYFLVLLRDGPFAGGKLETNVYSAAGWQYVLPSLQFGIAKRSVMRFANENGLRMCEMGQSMANLTRLTFNFSFAASMPLAEILTGMSLSDDGISLGFGDSSVNLTLERPVLERIRLLHAVKKYLPALLTYTEDYSGGILRRDGEYRAVYTSLELEAGGDAEFSILEELINWTIDYQPLPAPEDVVLANDIDWDIRGDLLASSLRPLASLWSASLPTNSRSTKKAQ